MGYQDQAGWWAGITAVALLWVVVKVDTVTLMIEKVDHVFAAPVWRTPEAQFWWCASVLLVILSIEFYPSYMPGNVLFSNDGPLGVASAAYNSQANTLITSWCDLNYLGVAGPAVGWRVSSPVGMSLILYGVAVRFVWKLSLCLYALLHRR